MDERDVRWYRLQWNITQPLISWLSTISYENVETGFLINDGDLSRFDFKLTRHLINLQSSILHCTITFSATYGRSSCSADVKYRILWNDVKITEDSLDNCFFDKTSNMTIPIQLDSRHLVQTLEPNCLAIHVNIRPIGLETIDNYGNLDMNASLLQLSKDMAMLFENPYGATLRIESTSDRTGFDVHPFILQYRWNYFCERLKIRAHELLEKDLKIEVHISSRVLRSILYFMYSGKLPGNYLYREFSSENAEMARVIQNHHFYNLYKFFVPRCKHIFRETLLNVVEWQYEIDFLYGDDAPEAQRVTIPIQQLSETAPYELKLYVFLRKKTRIGRWLSYNLVLLNTERLVCQLQIHVVGSKKALLHSRTYAACINRNNRSGPTIFMGSRKIFERFMVDGKLRLLFKIMCSDGKTKSITFDKASDKNNSLGYESALTDLSMDMEGVYKTGLQYNCEIIPRLSAQMQPCPIFLAHKAIIWARIPSLRNKVATNEPVEVEAEVKSMPEILHYIYAGRFSIIPKTTLAFDIFVFGLYHNIQVLKNYIRSLVPRAFITPKNPHL